MIKCEICNKEYNNLNGFGKHLRLTHNLSNKDYYDTYLRKPGEGVCPNCGKETQFRNNWVYLKFCSHKCSAQSNVWNVQKFGVTRSEFYSKIADDIKEDTKNRYDLKSYNRIVEILPKNNLELISHNNYETFNCKCLVCNKQITLSRYRIFYNNRNNLPLCYECHPRNPLKEEELFEYINEIYKGEISLHNHKILNGKELDVYLPELKLAFEFDGTYWHADPRFFKPDDVIQQKNLMAHEIWEYDKQKELMCSNVGVTLIRIKEYEWSNENEQTKDFIRRIINENSINC